MLRIRDLALLLALSFLTPCSLLPGDKDLVIEHIEVTQGIQDAINCVPLVAGRSAAVRVTVGVKGQPDQGVDGVTGNVVVLVNGAPIPGPPFDPINAPLKAPSMAAFKPNKEQHTLNFELTTPEFLKISAGVPVELVVSVGLVPGSADVDPELKNNTTTLGPLVFMNWQIRPTFYYVLIDYRPDSFPALGLPNASLVVPGLGDSMVRSVLPLRDDYDAYLSYPFLDSATGFVFEEQDVEGKIGGGSAEGKLFHLLDLLRWIVILLESRKDEETFLYGWLPKGALNGPNGMSFGRTGFGTVAEDVYQRTFAHELCHQLGISDHSEDRRLENLGGTSRHANARPGWDIGARLWKGPAGNAVKESDTARDGESKGHVKHWSLYDVLEPGWTTFNAWIDVKTYRDVLTPRAMHSTVITDAPSPTPDPTEHGANALLVRGTILPDQGKVQDLLPVIQLTGGQPTAIQRRGGGKYVVEVTGADGQPSVTVRFDALASIDSPKPGPAYFSVQVPFTGKQVRKVRVLDSATGEPLKNGEIGAGDNPPQPVVKITSPTPDSSSEKKLKLEWKFTDSADKPIAVKQGIVLYSPDGGKQWKVVAVGGNNLTKLLIDAKRLPKADKQGLIRILASDGLNTGMGEVTGLTVP